MRALVLLLSLWSAAQAQAQAQGSDIVPNPDPTRLTTSQLNSAISGLIDRMDRADTAIRQDIDTRLSAIDRATDLRLKAVDSMTVQLQKQSEQLSRIEEHFARVDVQFANVKGQFEDRDKTVADALAQTQKTAGDALVATGKTADTAIGVTKDLIAAQAKLFSESTNGITQSITELRRRADVVEGRTASLGEAKTGLNDTANVWIAFGGFGLAAIALFVALRKQPETVREVHYASTSEQPGVTTKTTTRQNG